MTVDDIALKVRSKNAGPFWITVDVFCGTPAAFERLRAALTSGAVAALYGVEPQLLKRFEIESLSVIKFSFPRPVVQGAADDRDMHGAQFAALLAEYAVA